MSPSDSSCNNKEIDSTTNDDGVCDVNDKLQNMSTTDKDKDIVSVCANCGKEGDDINNICNKCKQVKYCNASCKKKHRHKHKKECEEHIRLAAEQSAKLHDIELFKQPPPAEDCPICFIQLPTLDSGRIYMSCCGKVICSGCAFAPVYDNQGNKVDIEKQNECAFCRVVAPKSNKVSIERLTKRMEADDANAMHNLGMMYYQGTDGFPQDYTKALTLWHRAVEFGYSAAYNNIGYAYDHGQGVEVDEEKAVYYYELAAMGGDVHARHNLGTLEDNEDKFDRALKHYMIAVRGGESKSLDYIKDMYTNGDATKEDYTKALQAYQEYLGEIRSDQRDKAAAFSDVYPVATHESNRYY